MIIGGGGVDHRDEGNDKNKLKQESSSLLDLKANYFFFQVCQSDSRPGSV